MQEWNWNSKSGDYGRKNKSSPKTMGKEIRLQKERQWVLTYNGTLKHMAKNYRKRFHVDINTALSDLQAIGVEFTQEYLEAVKRSEEERIRQKHARKRQKLMEETGLLYADSDDRFAFIAGYTRGGKPYGTTWEELGLEPYASYEQLMEAYASLHGIGEKGDDVDKDEEELCELYFK